MMSRKRSIWLIVFIVVAGAVIYGYREYNRTNKDMKDARPDHSLPAYNLVDDFESNEAEATKKYNGKVVEVNGPVKSVEKDEKGYYTVILGDTSSMSSVRCSMDTVHQDHAARLANGSSVIVRGTCTGFNKDDLGLGSDVILNRCVIISNKSDR
jgi:hypothetical protein